MVSNGRWEKCSGLSIGGEADPRAGVSFRRKLPAYRMLEAGEIIREGDEVLEDGKWIPRTVLGAAYRPLPDGYHYPHRRPTPSTSKP